MSLIGVINEYDYKINIMENDTNYYIEIYDKDNNIQMSFMNKIKKNVFTSKEVFINNIFNLFYFIDNKIIYKINKHMVITSKYLDIIGCNRVGYNEKIFGMDFTVVIDKEEIIKLPDNFIITFYDSSKLFYDIISINESKYLSETRLVTFMKEIENNYVIDEKYYLNEKVKYFVEKDIMEILDNFVSLNLENIDQITLIKIITIIKRGLFRVKKMICDIYCDIQITSDDKNNYKITFKYDKVDDNLMFIFANSLALRKSFTSFFDIYENWEKINEKEFLLFENKMIEKSNEKYKCFSKMVSLKNVNIFYYEKNNMWILIISYKQKNIIIKNKNLSEIENIVDKIDDYVMVYNDSLIRKTW
uniref:Uncharacterized protein n=1 Tax=viral metagenome TaxID=1070528 RepID=A0A6C0H6D1_9ZZZZ